MDLGLKNNVYKSIRTQKCMYKTLKYDKNKADWQPCWVKLATPYEKLCQWLSIAQKHGLKPQK